MRSMGTMLVAGAATVVVWKIFAALFFGLLGMALKVVLVVGLVYFAMNLFNKKDKDEEE
jgi:hypothetical protein